MVSFFSYCPKGLLCRDLLKIDVCASLRSSVRSSVTLIGLRHDLVTRNGFLHWCRDRVLQKLTDLKIIVTLIRSSSSKLNYSDHLRLWRQSLVSVFWVLRATLPCGCYLVLASKTSWIFQNRDFVNVSFLFRLHWSANFVKYKTKPHVWCRQWSRIEWIVDWKFLRIWSHAVFRARQISIAFITFFAF